MTSHSSENDTDFTSGFFVTCSLDVGDDVARSGDVTERSFGAVSADAFKPPTAAVPDEIECDVISNESMTSSFVSQHSSPLTSDADVIDDDSSNVLDSV